MFLIDHRWWWWTCTIDRTKKIFMCWFRCHDENQIIENKTKNKNKRKFSCVTPANKLLCKLMPRYIVQHKDLKNRRLKEKENRQWMNEWTFKTIIEGLTIDHHYASNVHRIRQVLLGVFREKNEERRMSHHFFVLWMCCGSIGMLLFVVRCLVKWRERERRSE